MPEHIPLTTMTGSGPRAIAAPFDRADPKTAVTQDFGVTRHDDAMTLGTFGSVMIETRPIVSGENGGLGLDAVARRRRP